MWHGRGLLVVNVILALAMVACGGAERAPASSRASGSTPAESAERSTKGTAAAEIAGTTSITTSSNVATAASAMADSGLADPTALQLFSRRVTAATDDVSAALINTATRYCDSADSKVDTGNGSVVTAFDDVDPLGASVGDAMIETFNQCRVGNAILSGDTSYRLVSVTGMPFTLGIWSFTSSRSNDITTKIGASVSVHQGTETAVTEMNGAGEFVRNTTGSSTHNTTTGAAPLVMSRQYTVRTTTNNAIGSTEREFSIAHSNSAEGDTISVTTRPLVSTRVRGAPVALPAGAVIHSLANYNSGAIRVTESTPGGASVTSLVTVQPDGSARVERDLNGDGVAEQVFPSLPWAQLGDLHIRLDGAP